MTSLSELPYSRTVSPQVRDVLAMLEDTHAALAGVLFSTSFVRRWVYTVVREGKKREKTGKKRREVRREAGCT